MSLIFSTLAAKPASNIAHSHNCIYIVYYQCFTGGGVIVGSTLRSVRMDIMQKLAL